MTKSKTLTHQPHFKWNNAVFLCIGLCLVTYFIMEILCQGGFSQAFHFLISRPLAFLYNAALLFIPFTFLFLLRRRVFAATVISILWLLCGIANFIILNNRVTPFTYLDFGLLVSQISSITDYLSVWQLILLVVFLLALIAGLVVLFIKGPKHQGKISYAKISIGIVSYLLVFMISTALVIQTDVVELVFPNITISYKENGSPYSFLANALNRGIHKPSGYSEEAVEHLLQDKPTEDTPEENPNIIMLQLESFFDPAYVKDWTLSEDPIPTFHALKEQYSSGLFTVPGFGMGTVNTEFEVMTGMSVNYFGTGEYPYKTYLKNDSVESIAYNLLDLGYSTHVLHNNDATFYNRHRRISNLGIQTFTPVEFMNVDNFTPNGWAKDDVLIDEIEKTLDSTSNQDYIYAISVQGHGKYPTEPFSSDPKIKLSCSESEEKRCGYEYYVNQISEMDQDVAKLIEQLEARDEKTILVLYGDHLPTFDFTAKDMTNNSILQTEYVIWDNFGMTKEDKDLYAYQISAEVGNRIGLHSGTMMYYHQQYADSPDYQKNLKMLQYDMLYGEKYTYGGTTPYQKIDMRYDVEDITVSQLSNEVQGIAVKGEHFTPYSKLEVNGELLETTYIDPQTLNVANAVLKNGDQVRVEQLGKNGTSHLWRTEYYTFRD